MIRFEQYAIKQHLPKYSFIGHVVHVFLAREHYMYIGNGEWLPLCQEQVSRIYQSMSKELRKKQRKQRSWRSALSWPMFGSSSKESGSRPNPFR